MCVSVYICMHTPKNQGNAFQATSATWYQAGYIQEMWTDTVESWNWHFSQGYDPAQQGVKSMQAQRQAACLHTPAELKQNFCDLTLDEQPDAVTLWMDGGAFTKQMDCN